MHTTLFRHFSSKNIWSPQFLYLLMHIKLLCSGQSHKISKYIKVWGHQGRTSQRIMNIFAKQHMICSNRLTDSRLQRVLFIQSRTCFSELAFGHLTKPAKSEINLCECCPLLQLEHLRTEQVTWAAFQWARSNKSVLPLSWRCCSWYIFCPGRSDTRGGELGGNKAGMCSGCCAAGWWAPLGRREQVEASHMSLSWSKHSQPFQPPRTHRFGPPRLHVCPPSPSYACEGQRRKCAKETGAEWWL